MSILIEFFLLQAKIHFISDSNPQNFGHDKRQTIHTMFGVGARFQRAAVRGVQAGRRQMSGHSAEEAKQETLDWKKYSASK